jgi:hypothetical protein
MEISEVAKTKFERAPRQKDDSWWQFHSLCEFCTLGQIYILSG